MALELDAGAMVHVFHLLQTVDDVPFALETTFLPADLTPGILDLADEGSLWATLRDRYGIELSRSTAVLESIVFDDSDLAVGTGEGTVRTTDLSHAGKVRLSGLARNFGDAFGARSGGERVVGVIVGGDALE